MLGNLLSQSFRTNHCSPCLNDTPSVINNWPYPHKPQWQERQAVLRIEMKYFYKLSK